MNLQVNGPLLDVELHFPAATAKVLAGIEGETQVPQPVAGKALVDTGASRTVVDRGSLEKLGVQPIGITDVLTPSGGEQQLLFPADIKFVSIPGAGITAHSVLGSEHLAKQGILALLGRDVLRHCVLIYNGHVGQMVLSF